MKNLTGTICLTLAVLLGSVGDNESSSETPYLTGEQIRALVSGNEMDYEDSKHAIHVMIEDDGELIARFSGNTLSDYGS